MVAEVAPRALDAAPEADRAAPWKARSVAKARRTLSHRIEALEWSETMFGELLEDPPRSVASGSLMIPPPRRAAEHRIDYVNETILSGEIFRSFALSRTLTIDRDRATPFVRNATVARRRRESLLDSASVFGCTIRRDYVKSEAPPGGLRGPGRGG
jgi:hypothetical protein